MARKRFILEVLHDGKPQRLYLAPYSTLASDMAGYPHTDDDHSAVAGHLGWINRVKREVERTNIYITRNWTVRLRQVVPACGGGWRLPRPLL